MKTCFVNTCGRHGAQTAHHFYAYGHTSKQSFTRQGMALGSSQQGGHNDHAGMHRAAFVGVVKVFTVCGNAVDKRSAFYAALLLKTEHGAIAVLLERAERSLDIKLMTRRNADARHIHDQSLPNILA